MPSLPPANSAGAVPCGACPGRHWLALPLWKTQWGLASRGTCYPCLWFASCPLSPRPPSQREGGFLGYFMQGASPLASPGLSRRRHLQPLPKQKPCGGLAPGRHWLALPRGRGPSQTPPSRATDSSISPGPPPSLAAGTANRKAALSVLRRVGEAKGTAPRGAPVRQGL